MENRRNTQRAAIIADIEVTEVVSGTRLSARTSDVSITGCYVDTLNPTAAGTDIRVRLVHAGEELNVLARVVYLSPRLGMGIRFDESMVTAERAILERWVAEPK